GLTRYNYHFDNLPIPTPIVKIKSINYNISENILISNQQKITLPSNSFNITFDIDVLSFIDENSNTIQYKLEGFDQDWFDFQKNITTNFLFRKLPYGNYRLKLRAKNAVGIVSDEISSPLIVVEKPYYLSPIFILLVLIIISVVIFLVIKYFSNWQYRKKLEEEVKARTNELLESQLRYKQ
ncbi:MAG TPA: triple tyrosine motif-containing protein, partial [Candidatus Kapabacteria bacterium]|nr:triple tyrosine motif-containing protein [Candidatus Kapabacteria bacterium]